MQFFLDTIGSGMCLDGYLADAMRLQAGPSEMVSRR